MNSQESYLKTKHYSILDFSPENFKFIIAQHTEFPIERLDRDDLFKYLCRYLGWNRVRKAEEVRLKPEAKYMLVENEYSSDSYLRDFRAYYFDCYKPLPKFSQRVHFFQEPLTGEPLSLEKLEKIVTHEEAVPKDFWEECYLGYVVLRPFSSTVFGVCLLKTYLPKSTTEKRRCYTSTHSIRFDVLGHTIRNFEALPFLNQDGAIGACATSAIWSSFFKLSHIFKTKFLAPHEITQNAGLSIRVQSSPYPSKGLDGYQITKTISKNDLSFDYLEKPMGKKSNGKRHTHIPFFELKRILYAYNKKLGIPSLISYEIPDYETQHLVCLAGYRIVNKGLESYIQQEEVAKLGKDFTPIRSEADNIMRLYVHNDVFGPFAKVDFIEVEQELDGITPDPPGDNSPSTQSNSTEKALKSQDYDSFMKSFQIVEELDDLSREKSTNGQDNSVTNGKKFERTFPIQVFVPLAPSIRIRYKSIYRSAQAFELILKSSLAEVNSNEFDPKKIVWDIYMDFGVGFKNDRLSKSFNESVEEPMSDEMRKAIAVKALPKFIWVASMSIGEVTFLDILYDPTTLPEEFCVREFYIYDKKIMELLQRAAPDIIDGMIGDADEFEILTSNHRKFIEYLSEEMKSLNTKTVSFIEKNVNQNKATY